MPELTQNKEIADPAHRPISERNLGRRFLQNTLALLIGWNVNAIVRLLIARQVVHSMGTEVFAEYALIIVWITITEWILDFGSTEVFVREVNQNPQKRTHLVRVFLALKGFQAPAALVVLFTGMVAMQYPHRTVLAGMVAGISLIFIGGVTLCRATFKASLKMEREVLAEFVSVAAMFAFLPLLTHFHLGLLGLMTLYAISRGIFLAGCLLMSRKLIAFSVRGVDSKDLRWAIQASSAIGIIGFIAVVYNGSDLLVLSRVTNLDAVAVYSVAQRFTQPLLMVLSAISVSVYPVLALLKSPERFRSACQRALDMTLLVGGFALVGLWCGAEFFMSILGKDFIRGADALRVLTLVCVVRAVSLVIGPVLFLVRAQTYALGYMLAGLVLKVVIMVAAAPRFGYMGAAVATLLVEALFTVPSTLYFVRAFTGFTPRIGGVLRVAAIVLVVLAVTRITLPHGGVAAAAMAMSLYAGLVLACRVVPLSELRQVLRREAEKTSVA